jgi:hypothetical protein
LSPEFRAKSHDRNIANIYFQNVTQFKYFGTTVTNRNLIYEKIKRAPNSGNACYHSVQNLLSSGLLPKNIKIKICKTTILPVVLYGRETCSETLKEECRLKVFEKRLLRRISGPRRDEVTGSWRGTGCVARMGRRGMHVGFRRESQKERDHQED